MQQMSKVEVKFECMKNFLLATNYSKTCLRKNLWQTC